jgi:molybdopterin converting factor small subunit
MAALAARLESLRRSLRLRNKVIGGRVFYIINHRVAANTMLALFLNHPPMFVAGAIALCLSLALFVGALIAATVRRASEISQLREVDHPDATIVQESLADLRSSECSAHRCANEAGGSTKIAIRDAPRKRQLLKQRGLTYLTNERAHSAMSEDGDDDPLSDGAEIALLPARSGATAADNEGAIRFQRLEIEICDRASTHRAVRWPTPILVANPLRRSIRLSGARVKRPSSTASTIVTSGFSGGELKLLPEGSQFIPKPYDAAQISDAHQRLAA